MRFRRGDGEIAGQEYALAGDEAIFDRFEEGIGGLLFDVAFDDECLARWRVPCRGIHACVGSRTIQSRGCKLSIWSPLTMKTEAR